MGVLSPGHNSFIVGDSFTALKNVTHSPWEGCLGLFSITRRSAQNHTLNSKSMYVELKQLA